jgi:hypothetical protein
MDNGLARLKKVLLVKVILTVILWAIPSLFAPPLILEFFGLPTVDLTILRIFGAVLLSMSVAYWFAYKDPLRNLAIIWMGIVDNGLVALVSIILGFTIGVSWFFWLSSVIVFLFFIAFLILVPKSDIYKESA